MATSEHDLQTFPPPQPEPEQQRMEGGYQPAEKLTEGGYQPAPAQFPLQSTSFPAQTNPPGYGYAGQVGYHPITDTSTMATVVTAQPTVTSVVAPPEEENIAVAVTALVLSIVTMIFCGVLCLYPLSCTIPALILGIVAMVTRGTTQKVNAGVSIGLSATVIVINVVFGIIFGITYAVIFSQAAATAASYQSCSSYYSSTYQTLCIPDSYLTSTCSYTASYYSTGSYCPT